MILKYWKLNGRHWGRKLRESGEKKGSTLEIPLASIISPKDLLIIASKWKSFPKLKNSIVLRDEYFQIPEEWIVNFFYVVGGGLF